MVTADDEHIGVPELIGADEDQESFNEVLNFGVQDDGIIDYMHNIIIMTYPDEIIRTSRKTRQIVPLRNIVCVDPQSLLCHNWNHGL
jgi:hypothetical protein